MSEDAIELRERRADGREFPAGVPDWLANDPREVRLYSGLTVEYAGKQWPYLAETVERGSYVTLVRVCISMGWDHIGPAVHEIRLDPGASVPWRRAVRELVRERYGREVTFA